MPSTADTATRKSLVPRAVAGWLVGPMMLLASAGVGLVVMRGSGDELASAFGAALAGIVATSLVWILVSVFWPAQPDRICPECGREELRRSDAASMRGVVCGGCGSEDPERSAFLFAEAEEGPIEQLVARERAR